MTYELNAAFDLAARDDDLRCIGLASDGPHFSSGQDLRARASMDAFEPVGTWGGFSLPGAEGSMAVEHEIHPDMCWRWRNRPKSIIAQVQGEMIAAGLTLVRVRDLVAASDDAWFSDPVVVFGVSAVGYFAHPREVSVHKAREMLFTGEPITADEGLDLAKRSVNQAQDERGLCGRHARRPCPCSGSGTRTTCRRTGSRSIRTELRASGPRRSARFPLAPLPSSRGQRESLDPVPLCLSRRTLPASNTTTPPARD